MDGDLDANDIDELAIGILNGDNTWDLDLDGSVNHGDLDYWVTELYGTYIGDSNLDGEFNTGDFVEVFIAGEYEDGITGNSTWATGDWNLDREFDSGDFVQAFVAGGYELGPRWSRPMTVPEPTGSLGWLASGLIGWAVTRRKYHSDTCC